jgi:hypothetical protein
MLADKRAFLAAFDGGDSELGATELRARIERRIMHNRLAESGILDHANREVICDLLLGATLLPRAEATIARVLADRASTEDRRVARVLQTGGKVPR